jgi:hypothetical protein
MLIQAVISLCCDVRPQLHRVADDRARVLELRDAVVDRAARDAEPVRQRRDGGARVGAQQGDQLLIEGIHGAPVADEMAAMAAEFGRLLIETSQKLRFSLSRGTEQSSNDQRRLPMTTLLTTRDIAPSSPRRAWPPACGTLVRYSSTISAAGASSTSTAAWRNHSADGVIELMPIADAASTASSTSTATRRTPARPADRDGLRRARRRRNRPARAAQRADADDRDAHRRHLGDGAAPGAPRQPRHGR